MYYSMKNLGDENVAILSQLHDEDEKWSFLRKIADSFGFAGIQLESRYSREYGLSVDHLPDNINKSFRLTYHRDFSYHMSTTEDEEMINEVLNKTLLSAVSSGVEDVSLHPPLLANVSITPPIFPDDAPEYREKTRERFGILLNNLVPRFLDHGISLSIESHVTSNFFVFTGITDYCDFILGIPGLGGLIDISHNCHDGIEMDEILSAISKIPVKGFHLSDAIHGMELGEGTHLPLGQGNINLKALVLEYSNDSVYGALEVHGSAKGIADSLSYLKNLE
jgi:sugar phosphate isomerase/epimerase